MNVANLELDAGTGRGLAEPQVEVHVLMLIKEQVVIAAALITQVINDLADVLALQFWLNLAVGQQVDDVGDQRLEVAGDSAR